jgi:16S rRNA processing protein RimM
MRRDKLLVMGAVVCPHGIQGKIRVSYQGDDPRQFVALREIRLGNHPNDLTTHRVIRTQPYGKGFFILTLEGFTLQRARNVVGQFAWVLRDELPRLEESEYYWEDLIGLRVVTEEEEDLGIVRGIFSTGSNEVLACRSEIGELLVPFIEDVVLDVDLEAGIIHIRLAEGLT